MFLTTVTAGGWLYHNYTQDVPREMDLRCLCGALAALVPTTVPTPLGVVGFKWTITRYGRLHSAGTYIVPTNRN